MGDDAQEGGTVALRGSGEKQLDRPMRQAGRQDRLDVGRASAGGRKQLDGRELIQPERIDLQRGLLRVDTTPAGLQFEEHGGGGLAELTGSECGKRHAELLGRSDGGCQQQQGNHCGIPIWMG